MHESLQSDSITPPGTESELYPESSKSNEATSTSHPWLQLHTITSFAQMNMSPSVSCSEGKTICNGVSRTSESSQSSGTTSDETNHAAVLEDFSINSSKHQKKFRQHCEHQSDPSHDRQRSRRGSHSNFANSDTGNGFYGANHSLKRKYSSSENTNQRNYHRQNSAGIDESKSKVTDNKNSDQYKLAVNGSKAVRAVNNRLSSSLLIESLIDQMCKMMIPETNKQKAMYKIICNKLYEMHMIDNTYAVDELQIVRNHYQKALYQMFTMGRSVTQASHESEFLLPIPSVKIEFPLGQSIMEVSRYKDEFEELKFLAKGGFGKVYRVRHRLDGAFYAVKKIPFRNNDRIMQSVREVKMLANLNHPNVVSYKAAWIEPAEYTDFANISASSTRSTTGTDTNNSSNCFKVEVPPNHHSDNPDSEDIIFADSAGDGKIHGAKESAKDSGNPRIKYFHEKVTKRTKTTVSFDSQGSFRSSFVESRNVVSSSISNAVLPYRACTFSKESRGKCVVGYSTLFVQMQLCELTLRQWLDERNKSTSIDIVVLISSGLELFRQIVQGVSYIHAQKIVHHDIKPSNIFVSKDLSLVQVGDFGLSCWFRPHWKHGCNIGTPQYAAPEQLTGECDPKSDIFSLGIILVEILTPFQTVMERAETLKKLRKGKIPLQLEAVAPPIAALVARLIEPKSNLRPTATELLNDLQNVERLKCVGQCLNEKNKLINEIKTQYEAVIESKDKEILELKKRLRELERICSRDEDDALL